MSLVDGLLVTGILAVLVLVFWSRIMQQSVLDTMRELKIILEEMKTPIDE